MLERQVLKLILRWNLKLRDECLLEEHLLLQGCELVLSNEWLTFEIILLHRNEAVRSVAAFVAHHEGRPFSNRVSFQLVLFWLQLIEMSINAVQRRRCSTELL